MTFQLLPICREERQLDCVTLTSPSWDEKWLMGGVVAEAGAGPGSWGGAGRQCQAGRALPGSMCQSPGEALLKLSLPIPACGAHSLYTSFLPKSAHKITAPRSWFLNEFFSVYKNNIWLLYNSKVFRKGGKILRLQSQRQLPWLDFEALRNTADANPGGEGSPSKLLCKV